MKEHEQCLVKRIEALQEVMYDHMEVCKTCTPGSPCDYMKWLKRELFEARCDLEELRTMRLRRNMCDDC
jgi:hypothetical protein